MIDLTVYIINLPRSIDRRLQMEKRFNALSIPVKFAFIEGVDGYEQSNHPLFKKYHAQKHFFRKGRTLSQGELGCFASHYLAWVRCIEDNQPVIIIEDDTHLLETFPPFYRAANRLATHCDFIWLHQSKRRGRKMLFRQLSDELAIFLHEKDYLGSIGYLLTPNAAKQLVDYHQTWALPVDDSMAQYYKNGLLPLAIYPAVIQTDEVTTSTIGKTQRTGNQLSLGIKLLRELFNAYDRVRRTYVFTLYRFKLSRFSGNQ